LANVSPQILELLNLQISHEAYNSQLYHKLGSYLKNIGLDNIGEFFYSDQVDEEHKHQKLISKYLVDRNEKVEMYDVPAVEENFQNMTFIQLAELYLKTEQGTTEKLKNIASVALEESDFMTFGFMQEMIKIQITEEDEAITFLDRARMTANDMGC
jgi:ferritin